MLTIGQAKDVILGAENVASEVIRCMYEDGEIPREYVKPLLEWSGDDEYVTVEDII